ncbi:hypothetical protein ST47_g9154 [Ascochyta rabiei]|uniref:Uncharacterized protein n=1 Tax=Didymella rabiei TaxID=5454 RepID=A0A162Y155_DIDRA|nr:hypothetical protein ST47_g9154 [Ascochyta rabiei]
MSEQHPKKPEARPAGAPPNRNDVFNPTDDKQKRDAASADEGKISIWDALKDKGNAARRKSMQFLGLDAAGKRDGGKEQ